MINARATFDVNCNKPMLFFHVIKSAGLKNGRFTLPVRPKECALWVRSCTNAPRSELVIVMSGKAVK